MGDRANIVIPQQGMEGVSIYLYSHWGGTELPVTLQTGLLAGKQRWDDQQYLARIIFNTMTAGNEKGEAGFGISAQLCDNEYPLLVVDTAKQEVRVTSEDGAKTLKSFSFQEYVELPAKLLEWSALDPEGA